ncbi:hypothetical protein ZPR_3549 [Zunongwangia profunda SM-A87]|uniref:Uncharacterized protein n=1 Tax=Zunongwangia profunda (strain DSM 18752 / CCTCC AB 206139 / SM-A87) TaxID=655815 RepID=D5BK16_ZUNPS|nr:hypothetical protein ZPR_3549 [Zunongwangia profunda SM-A87]
MLIFEGNDGQIISLSAGIKYNKPGICFGPYTSRFIL